MILKNKVTTMNNQYVIAYSEISNIFKCVPTGATTTYQTTVYHVIMNNYHSVYLRNHMSTKN